MHLAQELIAEIVPVAVMMTLMNETGREEGETAQVSNPPPNPALRVEIPTTIGSQTTWKPWSEEHLNAFIQALSDPGVSREPNTANQPKPSAPPAPTTL